MFRRLFGAMAIVGVLALSTITLSARAAATPITVQLFTETAAVAEGTADTHSDSGPASAGPLLTSSVVVGATEFGSGGAIAADGLLSTSAEVASGGDFASGVGSSRYLASFAGAGGAAVHLDFETLDFFGQPSATSLATAILLIYNDGIKVLDEVITLSGLYDFRVDFTTGLNQSIDLILTSEAYALASGSASNFASVAINVTLLPEPGSLALAVVALVALRSVRRGGRTAPAPAVPA